MIGGRIMTRCEVCGRPVRILGELTAERLDEIQARWTIYMRLGGPAIQTRLIHDDLPALLDACRALWEENDELDMRYTARVHAYERLQRQVDAYAAFRTALVRHIERHYAIHPGTFFADALADLDAALEEEPKLRSGDVVRHTPSGETWVVATVDGDGEHFRPAGWPYARARIADVDIIKRVVDTRDFDSDGTPENVRGER